MSRSRCVPCEMNGLGYAPSPGFGTIVMQPLRGATGLGAGETQELALRAGVAGPLGLMAGAAVVYGGVSGIAARSWKVAGTGALLGAGLTGMLAGGSAMALGANVGPADPEAQGAMMTIGAPAALIGAGLLAWGGYRAYKKRR